MLGHDRSIPLNGLGFSGALSDDIVSTEMPLAHPILHRSLGLYSGIFARLSYCEILGSGGLQRWSVDDPLMHDGKVRLEHLCNTYPQKQYFQ